MHADFVAATISYREHARQAIYGLNIMVHCKGHTSPILSAVTPRQVPSAMLQLNSVMFTYSAGPIRWRASLHNLGHSTVEHEVCKAPGNSVLMPATRPPSRLALAESL